MPQQSHSVQLKKVGLRFFRLDRHLAIVGLLAAFLGGTRADAQVCIGSAIGFDPGPGNVPAPVNCINFLWCHPPELLSVRYDLIPSTCDPEAQPCSVRGVVPGRFPGNSNNHSGIFPDSPIKLIWNNSSGGFVGSCGNIGARIQVDEGEAWIQASNFSCADPGAAQNTDTYTLTAIACDGVGGCEVQRQATVPLTAQAMSDALCEPDVPAPGWSCGEGDACDSGCFGPGGGGGGHGGSGGSSAAGGGPGVTPDDNGPGAMLRYLAGGSGSDLHPRPTGWSEAFGRYWSHDYAETLVEDPDAGHVVMLTRFATFREFADADLDGVYETSSPGDEYRRLTKTVDGWELRDLNGTVQHFGNDGLWIQTVDKNGNATVATYAAGQLTRVDFADQRAETFAYQPGGKLASITEIGIDGVTQRTWTYTWSGDDLERVDRPDGTAWAMRYDDPAHPGFLTRLTLVATDAGERIEGAWEYDAQGNVIRTWRGVATSNDSQAVDLWSFTFDDPALPAVTTVTDPLGNMSTYTFGRDPGSTKPRIEQVSGDCPTCGLGPNVQLAYGDPANPLRRTLETDGRGTMTLYAYDADGQLTSRVEALGTALERETTWAYDPDFPAFVTEIVRPSTTGDPLDERRTVLGFDTEGNQTTRSEEGFEAAVPFSFATVTTYTPQGRPEVVDPPGFGTADQTSFTYDPARGGLVMDTRTDPLIGTTTFGYDAFNRRTAVTDPNGVLTETTYDALDRVRFVTQRGEVPAGDLVSENVYDAFGDLFQIILPEGNVIEHGYDAAGRLVSVERKPDADPSSHGERTVWELDAFGHRVRESHQRWDGASWVTEAEREFVYTNRCQLDKTIAGPDSSKVSITEFAYDCDGNLERTWDANHPSESQTQPATTVYGYDELDRLTTLTQPWGGTGGGDAVTTYGYDVQDHLTQVTDAEGGITTYQYSDRDLLTEESSEVSGISTFTYNEHGELETETDARGVLVVRTTDTLDRVTLVDYPDDTLDVTYTYDDPSVPFSKGRLTRIARNGGAVDYAYDRFGRTTRDGELTYDHDRNGNRVEIGYPGDVTAQLTYDFADRPETLTVVGLGGAVNEPLVTAAGYKPAGPLTSLSLGNGLTETRGFDTRYHPETITVAGAATVLDWQYTTDGVGNIQTVTDLLDAANNRGYGYQDVQYFLSDGFGPWGNLTWTYDFIGNRLSEARDGQPADVYSYVPNGAGGNTARLDQVTLGSGGTRSFTYDAAGNQTQVLEGGEAVDFDYDDASRLAHIARPAGSADTSLRYDGRSFLRSSVGREPDSGVDTLFCDGFESGDTSTWAPGNPGSCQTTLFTRPVYSSDGILHYLDRASNVGPARADRYVFYFGSRPVATMELLDGTATVQYLSVDHLGTPVLATDDTGASLWQGGFEPFGADFSGADASGVFLRFPGQWADSSWMESSLDAELYYNVHRWYLTREGSYSRPDPLRTEGTTGAYSYVRANPLLFIDTDGRLVILRDFPTEEKKDVESAIEKLKARLRMEPCCVAEGRATRILDLLESNKETLTIKFRKNSRNCGFTPLTSMAGLRNTIRLGPAAWQCCIFGGPTGADSVASTVLHELHHLLFRTGEKPAQKAESRCFDCEKKPE